MHVHKNEQNNFVMRFKALVDRLQDIYCVILRFKFVGRADVWFAPDKTSSDVRPLGHKGCSICSEAVKRMK